MQKNESLICTIEDFTSEGLGVGHADGMAVFVKDTVIGDEARVRIVKVKKHYAYGRLEEILTPSPDRVKAPCPVARSCGGCQLQAMRYDAQLRFKQNKVKNNLMRLGSFAPGSFVMEEPIGMEVPLRYRNKAQFPIGWGKEDAAGRRRIVAGFYAGHTHCIIESEDCLLGIPENKTILETVIRHMERYHIAPYDEATGEGTVRHVMTRYGAATKELMTVLVCAKKQMPKEQDLAQALMQIPGMQGVVLNFNPQKTNVILGDEERVLAGRGSIEDRIGPVTFQISPHSFYQVNPSQTQRLYETARSFAGLTGQEVVWDLYCGIGTISLFLSGSAKWVYGVEIVPQAIADARENAARNGIENASFFVGKAEEVLPEKFKNEGIHADVIVVDPPRKGCDAAVLSTMLAMAPQRIVYVSCDSATLARDLKVLCEGGYTLEKVQVVDQFAMTVHCETVCLLRNRKPDERGIL